MSTSDRSQWVSGIASVVAVLIAAASLIVVLVDDHRASDDASRAVAEQLLVYNDSKKGILLEHRSSVPIVVLSTTVEVSNPDGTTGFDGLAGGGDFDGTLSGGGDFGPVGVLQPCQDFIIDSPGTGVLLKHVNVSFADSEGRVWVRNLNDNLTRDTSTSMLSIKNYAHVGFLTGEVGQAPNCR